MIRTVLLRGVWLMLGAAIGVAAGIIGVAAISWAVPIVDLASGAPWGVLAALVLSVPIGLLPGVREVEVTAARALLGVTAPLLSEVRDWRQRWRTALWALVHTATGLVCGFCLCGLLPGAVVAVWLVASGQQELLPLFGLSESLGRTVLEAIAITTAAFGGPVLMGMVAARLAPVVLGPTDADRLAIAEQRLATARRHTVLARELHDGIGHALSIISIQAAAARRVSQTQPERASAALNVIEQTSRGAQAELDHLLGLLRDPDAAAVRATRDDLPSLVERHRAAGLEIEMHDDHGTVPALVWHAVLDILAEALTNAHRHAQPGPVTVDISRDTAAVQLEVRSQLAASTRSQRRASTRSGGRGILGMQERAALLDGTVVAGPDAGPDAGHWLVRATLPLGKGQ